MAKATFTARWVAAVKPSTETQVDYFDTKPPALGLRLAPSGRKTWFIMYRSWRAPAAPHLGDVSSIEPRRCPRAGAECSSYRGQGW